MKKSLSKKGVSTIVATVLIIAVTIISIFIISAGIYKIIKNNSYTNSNPSIYIDTSKGFTYWDEKNKLVSLQVRRETDDSSIKQIQVIFSINGNSVPYTVPTLESKSKVPNKNEAKVYYFDFSDSKKPSAVSIAPIFKDGQIGSIIDSESEFLTGESSLDRKEITFEIPSKSISEKKEISHMTWWISWKKIYEIDNGGPKSIERAENIIQKLNDANVMIPVQQSNQIGNSVYSINATILAWLDTILKENNANIQMVLGWSSIYGYAPPSVSRVWFGKTPEPAIGTADYNSNRNWVYSEALHTNYKDYPLGNKYHYTSYLICPNYRGSRFDILINYEVNYAKDLKARELNVKGAWIDHEIYADPRKIAYFMNNSLLYNDCERDGSLQEAIEGYKGLVTEQLDALELEVPEIDVSFFRGFDFNESYSIGGDGGGQYFPTVPGRTGSEPGLYNSCKNATPVEALKILIQKGLPVKDGRPTLLDTLPFSKTYDFCYILAKNGAKGVTFYYDNNALIGAFSEANDYLLIDKMAECNKAFEDYNNL